MGCDTTETQLVSDLPNAISHAIMVACVALLPITPGAAPTAAVRLLHQLRLMPQVFTPPPQLARQLGSEYGRQCVATMAAAESLIGALDLQVKPCAGCQATMAGADSRTHPVTGCVEPPKIVRLTRSSQGALHD